MDEPKTYFVLRNTHYAPDDLIQLGQLVPDPRLPYRRLVAPLQLSPVPRVSRKQAWAFEEPESSSGSLSVFAHFLAALTAEVSAHAASELRQTWRAATLETRSLELGVDEKDGYAQRSVRLEPVQQWLKEHKRLGKTVYMVTGVKVAVKPGEATYAAGKAHGGALRLDADPGTGGLAEVGAGGGYDRAKGKMETGTPEGDFVFAYRLRKVHISWRGKVRVGEDVGGGDLSGVRPEVPSDDEELLSSDQEDDSLDEDDEISDIKLERTDFGSLLPSKDIKSDGVDDDGEECMVILAADS